ncbi:unnamed protein product [Vitrella brassicaformis CCMP3155]|uniref:anthranilate phosphoribosyltransferase n=1 Tax=Vitrella brassicaformis (strain CCMP3155) TaxID=1169540 RepID=A0A0G4E8Z7_VITBC|nr:unnamed protein product [Vitrella brassicaformis CCMP3155]|eukprot:CEL91676.1 unnamed protein product [Vitrella brassicaformis CCMP3155]
MQNGVVKLKNLVEKLIAREDLGESETAFAIDELLTFDVSTVSTDPDMQALAFQIPAFLTLLRSKGETAEEVWGIVKGLRSKGVTIRCQRRVLDIVGTGGDGMHTVNISTGASILAAACGVPMAKHGNRSVSSMCGSADVLEEFGVNLDLSAEGVKRCIDELGMGFCFAQKFHPAMRKVREIRKGLGVPTVFNLIGPLLNPALSEHHLIGVYDPAFLDLFAGVLVKAGAKHSMVFHGQALDELSPLGPAQVAEVLDDGTIKHWTLDPKDYDISYCKLEDLKGGPPSENASLLMQTFEGKKGPIADTLALNAGVALWCYGSAPSIKEGVEAAREALQAKKAKDLLAKWVALSKQLT